MDSISVLKKYYGYDSFRPGQKEIIDAILDKKDVLGIMPTGGGKSICYQIPALLLEGVTIVISPLISLMKDQVDTLKEYGIAAELINSTLSNDEFREIMDSAREGNYKLLYVAPERLETESFLSLLEEIPVSMVAVDEAHCVSQWGHDFRPSYRRIHSMIERLSRRPIVTAFTATATPHVKADIVKLLDLYQPFKYVGSFDRSNLYFEVRKPSNKLQEIQNYLNEHRGESGIIYCATRKNVNEVCERLSHLGIVATKYHAGLSDEERKQNQESFLFDEVPLIVATNAFGMGIDKPNVRFVLHYNMPKNMEGYYQEAGRAGRDGEAAECILLFSTQDIMTNRYLIERGSESGRTIEYDKLNKMVDYCNTGGCLRDYILQYFGEKGLDEPCHNCGSCNNDIEETDITIEAQKILSCVKRMHEKFGAAQVADVLKGANTQKIRSLHFNELSTYGIMSDYSKEVIKELISYLIAEGKLCLAGTEYPVVQLTEESYSILKGAQKISIRRVISKETKKDFSSSASGIWDHMLFEYLRKARQEEAIKQSIQPFMVFPDTTLREMARVYPINIEELLQVSGVGEYKANKYGELFTDIIREYVESHPIEVKRIKDLVALEPKENKLKPQSSKFAQRDSHKLTYELYVAGHSVDEIANERNLTTGTVENHLIKCAQEGMKIQYEDFIPSEYEALIMKTIEECGASLLKPIKEQLPEEISYTTIKFAVLKYSMNK